MSDELDKFVLQYTVEIKDAITRLEQLNQKVSNTTKNAKKGGEELKVFASGAADEIGKLVPGVDKVSSAVKLLSTEFVVAGAAVGALAIGVKSVMDMRQQYNQQRKEGMDIGISALRLEEYQRKFAKQSGGHITREQTAEEVKKLSQFSSAIYKDPTRIGTEARTARVLGINVGQPGQHVSVNSLMTQLGEKFSKMTDAQVQAQAKTLGMNQDFALSLKKQGASVGKVTEITPEELESRSKAQKELDKFNEVFAKLSEDFKIAANTVGEKLLPPFTRFVAKMAELSNKIPAEKIGKWTDNLVDVVGGAIDVLTFTSPVEAALEKARLAAKNKPTEEAGKNNLAASKSNLNAAKTGEKTGEKTAKTIDAMLDGADEDNSSARNIADQQGLAINQFAGAVASFSNAVDEKQAWAAWAGEVGRASGLNAPKGSEDTQPAAIKKVVEATKPRAEMEPPTKSSTARGGAYDDLFKEAGAKYNIDPNILKNIARVESGFNPRAVSEKGATGLMQVMPANFKSLGITDGTDPRQNVMGGAKLFADYLKSTKGDVEQALMTYHAGFDKSGWGVRTKAYPGKVLDPRLAEQVSSQNKLADMKQVYPEPKTPLEMNKNTAVERLLANEPLARSQTQPTSGVGESKDKINLKSVQNTIAQRLGIPVQQLQRGEWSRGDVEFASNQIQSGIQNQIYDLKNQLKAVNLPQQTMSKMLTELRTQQTGLSLMRQYSPDVIQKAQPGERQITIGERAIIINVNGAIDPAVTAEHVKTQLDDHLGEIVNGTATGMKY